MRYLACAALLLLCPRVALAQAERPAPAPANTRIEGMPPVPQSIVDGVARYGRFRTAQLMAWHPTRRQMVINTAFGPTLQFHLVDGPGRDRRQLTWMPRGFSQISAWASFAPGNGDSFVFTYDASAELRSLYRYTFATGDVSRIVDAQTRYGPVWSRDGKWLVYDSVERNDTDRDLYVVQPNEPSTKRRLGDFSGPFAPQDWTPDGSAIIAIEVLSNNETYVWKVDVATGAQTPITKRGGEPAGFFNARLSPDGRKLYALSDRVTGDWRIWRCDLANCTWTAVTPPGVALDGPTDPGGGFELSPDGTLVAAVVDRGASSEIQVFDLTTLKARTLPAMPKGVASRLQWRPNSRELGFSLESVKAPADVYSIDTSLGTLTRWTASEVSFNSDVLPAPEFVEWKSFDGLAVSGILLRPSAKFTGPRPVVINIHGGPDARERAIWRGRSNYILEELGIAIIYPNVRGSTGYGRRFASLDDGKLRGDAVKDIGALLDWIATRPDFDKNRVMLLGVSSGGWLALESGVAYNDRIRGVIEGAGITNFVTFLEGTSPARQENRRHEYGDERDPAMREFLLSLSPARHASELKKPTLIIQPGKDARVPLAQAQELFNALRKNNQNVWYLEFSELNHDNFFLGGDYMYASWMLFFKNFLLN